MRKLFLGFCVSMLLCSLILPVEARTLFLQTKEQEAAGVGPASASYLMRTYKLKYASAKDLSETIAQILAEGEGVAVNEKLNTVFVRASEANQNRLAKLIKQLDQPPLQVQVEAKIIELKAGSGDTNNPSALGASWRYSNKQGSNDYIQQLTTETLTSAASSLGLYAQLLSGNVEAYLSALEKTIGYDLVASPWITALNHEEAEILIGSKYGYKTLLVTQTGTMQEIQFLEVGTKLKFTPHINEDGYIIMDIYPSVSEGSVTNDLPQENTTETKNKVLVKDGQSIVIGGLTKNYNQQVEIGVPILCHIPLLGTLFRRTELKSEKREIMVIITPHIVTPAFLEEMAKRAKELDARRGKWVKEKAKLIH